MSRTGRGHAPNARPAWNPQDDAETDTGSSVKCRGCGEPWTKQFARVFGNNDDEIEQCPECESYRELKNGAIKRGGS